VSDDYLWDRSGRPDPEVVRLEQLLGTLRQADPARLALRASPAPPGARGRFYAALGAAAAVILALVGLPWVYGSGADTGWTVTRMSGSPTVGDQPLVDQARLTVGRWLETRQDGRATIDVADVGQVQLEPETRLELLGTEPGRHRLHLERGTMHAVIWSPPGQFSVETPSSTAVDLGCAYTMTIDPSGAGLIRVTSGWVGFVWEGREAFIPAGAVCRTRPGLGPGTPRFEDTSDAFGASLEVLDTVLRGSPEADAALDRVLDEARPRDALTLWHLLSRVDPARREAVFERLAGFVPPPAGVTLAGIRNGSQPMLDRWWDELDLGSTNWWRLWEQEWRENTGRR
jgi:ferric-dicitrate binding protein FerR (iron transport regulator)